MKRFLLAIALLVSAAINHAQTYYLPPGVSNVRAMIIGGPPLGGGTTQIWRDFALAQRVGYAQLITDLPTIATASGHPEIANAPFVSIGNSAGASAAAAFAIANPTRAIAVVGLHGVMLAQGNTGFNANRGGENGDVPTLNFSGVYGVPMIHNFDNNDGFVSPVVLQGLVEFGRAQGALWTFLIHNDGNHSNSDIALTTLIMPWLAAVLDQRLPIGAGTGNGSVVLNALSETNGWLGDIKTKTVASFASFAGNKAKAAWFPNQAVANLWAGCHFIPPYTIPAQPVITPSGIIADLTILDPLNNDISSGTGWKINANFKEADQTGSLVKYFLMAPPPASVAGLDWIRPIVAGKNYFPYTADPIFRFRVTADATVYIAHPDSITPRPTWLSSWTSTGEQLVVTSGNLNSNAPRYTLFRKDFAANSTVTAGGTGSSTSAAMYLTLVKAISAPSLASVSITASDSTATENADSGAFTLSRTGATSNALSVNIGIAGTASAGVDFQALPSTLTIPVGQSSVDVIVNTVNDNDQESSETVQVTLQSNAAYNLGSPTSATVTIVDDDAPALPTISIADTLSTAAEPSTAGQFSVSRTGPTTAALTVNLSVSGSATAGADYAALADAVLIPAGSSSASISVTPIDDAIVETTETVSLSVVSHSNYVLGTITNATVEITDNDSLAGAPTVTLSSTDTAASEAAGAASTGNITVTRTGASTEPLIVDLIFSGSASNGVDLNNLPSSITIPVGQSSAALTVTPIDDALIEGQETLGVRLGLNASYVISQPNGIGILINDNDNATPLTTTGIVFATRGTSPNLRETKLNIYRPSTGTGPWPVVIYYPGGGWVSQNEGSISPLFTNLTAHGYAVVSANYVASSFARWPAQIQDAKAAVRWVRANAASYGFDPNKVAVVGTSSGGHMAAYVGASAGRSSARIGSETIDLIGTASGNLSQSDVVQVAAPFYPPTDLLAMDHYPTPDVPDHNAASSPESNLIGTPIQTVPNKTATANPLIFTRPSPAIPSLPPFWIVHGSADRSVQFNQSERLNAALVGNGQRSIFWPVLGAGHGTGVIDSQEVHSLFRSYLDRTLLSLTGNAAPVPRIVANALTGTAPLTVNLDGSTSSDSDGVITKFSWSSGDNTGGAGTSLSVTFAKPGIYPVTLAVRDDLANTASTTVNIIVNPANAPSATPPTGSVTTPLAGAVYSPTGDLLIESAVSAGAANTISNVEFFLNGQLFAWDSKLPYNTTVGGLPPGLYSATVRVTDNLGAAVTSAPVAFRVSGCDLFCSGFED